ncbi:hypothetical protein DACRYDRAFT_14549 [Dacryopinax primogenitus]|uniref:Uncharacterized protein n=1 Tax=Dacryopinax primogenitus (strain DJM 731) TaxID=1858805 RepID=M5GDG0_DACPD|nr:uncharacterized protein DACRYDRAFT_14549 [Dacryopinax primogenitus]EJU04502.1 hypothetical protein DACRYDRAFT_14549 [Dacryopinax primogenitus]
MESEIIATRDILPSADRVEVVNRFDNDPNEISAGHIKYLGWMQCNHCVNHYWEDVQMGVDPSKCMACTGPNCSTQKIGFACHNCRDSHLKCDFQSDYNAFLKKYINDSIVFEDNANNNDIDDVNNDNDKKTPIKIEESSWKRKDCPFDMDDQEHHWTKTIGASQNLGIEVIPKAEWKGKDHEIQTPEWKEKELDAGLSVTQMYKIIANGHAMSLDSAILHLKTEVNELAAKVSPSAVEKVNRWTNYLTQMHKDLINDLKGAQA